MSIYYIPEHMPNSFYEVQLPNGKYRYKGYRHGIQYCLDVIIRKTEFQIYDFLDNCSVDALLNNERYIVNLD
jgi:hypothetical protein